MGASDLAIAMTTPKAMSAADLLFELQVEQHHHDEIYHREISRLSLHQRLNHMALHFAKYAGKVAADESVDVLIVVYTDTLIIALSTANVLNTELWTLIEPEQREFPSLMAFARSLAVQMNCEMADHACLLRETAIASGRMAAACEKIDHLEEISFRAEIKESIASLSRIALAFMSSHKIEPADAVRNRLTSVKKRLKLHHRI